MLPPTVTCCCSACGNFFSSATSLFSVPLFCHFPWDARSIENASPAFATLHTLLCNQDVTVPHLLQKVDTCRFHRHQQHSVVKCSLSSSREPSFQNLYGQELQFGTPPFTFLYSGSIVLHCWRVLLLGNACFETFHLVAWQCHCCELWAPCCPLLLCEWPPAQHHAQTKPSSSFRILPK